MTVAPWPVFRDGTHDTDDLNFKPSTLLLESPVEKITFMPCTSVSNRFHALFAPLPGYFSAFLTVLVTIGLERYLASDATFTCIHCHYQDNYSGMNRLFHSFTGISPSMSELFRTFQLCSKIPYYHTKTPHLLKDSVWAFPFRSPLLGNLN